MAPSPEYDKEPKAPDKSATCESNDETKSVHNSLNDQQKNSDHKLLNSIGNSDVENKHVETLDDGQLRALLDEAITYKCPKDREGKSSLFKELLEEVEQDDQACEAAARTVGTGRGSRRAARARPPLSHSNSLQDLVAALAAEPSSRRHHARHAAPASSTTSVSARAIHGGSLPSGVNTSSLLCEEPARGAGYLATVRCVNPPPLAERRVSASDANSPHEMESLNRRSKPMFPMTYTARATLEIGSGSVSSGRAVTTTTASNQVGGPETQARRPAAGGPRGPDCSSADWLHWVDTWYEGLADYAAPGPQRRYSSHEIYDRKDNRIQYNTFVTFPSLPNYNMYDEAQSAIYDESDRHLAARSTYIHCDYNCENIKNVNSKSDIRFKKECKERIGKGLVVPGSSEINPRSLKTMTISANPVTIEHNKSKGNKKIITSKYSKIIDEPKNTNENASEKKIDDVMSSKDCFIEVIELPKKSNEITSMNKIKSLDTNYSSNVTLTKDFDKTEDDPEQLCNKRDLNVDVKHSINISCYSSKDTSSGIEDKPKNIDEYISNNDTDSLDNEFQKSEAKLLDQSNYFIDSKKVDVPENICNETVNIKPSVDELSDKERSELALINNNNNINANEVCYEILEVIDCKTVDIVTERGIEMVVIPSNMNLNETCIKSNFTQYMDNQQKLMTALKSENTNNVSALVNENLNKDIPEHSQIIRTENTNNYVDQEVSNERTIQDMKTDVIISKCTEIACIQKVSNSQTMDQTDNTELKIQQNKNTDGKAPEKYTIADFPYSAYIFLTQPKRLLASLNNCNERLQIQEFGKNTNIKPYISDNITSKKKKKEKAQSLTNSKKDALINKNALKVLLFEDLSNDDDRTYKTESGKYGQTSDHDKEVDSAIPFSCITSPEVVTSCNTTSSTSQSAVAVDPKPLQLGSCYRAVASLTGDPSAARAASLAQPRSVISSTFNGLTLSRPNYGSTASTANDDYKKSIDENGNSLQAFSSPLGGSGQHKKPRRKKSSKNETVIDCRQIDGYQGDKDVNELLRFIESDAESVRPKLRTKHRDDNDDKAAKKRSTERRKDKDHKAKRASSLEELSRTTLEELTGPRADTHTKPERRSWGDTRDEPDPPVDPPTDPPAELTDFQTVTKRRKPRRRLDDPPRRRHDPPAAPCDSGDDAAPPPLPLASYADIARTRHNIPDLIESCNYYAEGQVEHSAEPPAPPPDRPRPRRDHKAARPAKERSPPAPDVVADRRPAVILLDAEARAPDMEGVTFGFDVNEQLVGGGRRVDLLSAGGLAAGGLAVRAGALLVRYVPPPPPHDTNHLLQIVDYVGSAWEEVVRCGGGKVRYYSE